MRGKTILIRRYNWKMLKLPHTELKWGNPECTYTLRKERLETGTAESELEILLNGKLNMSHGALAARRPNHFLSGIRHSQGRERTVVLCSALGWPYLKCWVQFWVPQYKKKPLSC